MIDKRLKIWFFKNEGFSSLIYPLSRLFNCSFQKDFENVWEWMEGYSERYKLDVNISRAHEDWSGDEFLNPVMILFDPYDFNFYPLELIQLVAKEISDELGTKVYYGHVVITGDDGYEYCEIGKAGQAS